MYQDHVTAELRYEHQDCARCTAVPIPEVRGIGDLELAGMMIKASTDKDCPDCHGRRVHHTPAAKAAHATYERLLAERCTRTFADVRKGDQILYRATARKGDTRQTWQRVTEVVRDGDRVLFRTDSRRSRNPLSEPAAADVLVYLQDGTPKECMREAARLHPDGVTFRGCDCC
ncbi:hypothetical protein H114_32699 [Streptomyces gancidicus BKS 13-15]|uniref:Uncharacterized protein n=1 Tax=Streptomyces gancidicus BKS 13-15 TaxID=1284664 RepID=M3DG91_STREZ|nr:hypothetical protein [Streptomyces gancidicus]EMF20401.1 hypothetical protein H114_32699 [Streptomyces gancidicus BKS 13-15]